MIKKSTENIINELFERYPALEVCRQSLKDAIVMISDMYRSGGKLLICGNGGSAADSEHIVGELMKGFIKKRPIDNNMYEKMKEICPNEADYFKKNLQGALPAVSLMSPLAINTAFSNDQAPELAMAQQVLGLGKPGDVLLGISTSGNSANVVYAIMMAKVKDMKTFGLIGNKDCKMKSLVDIAICAPSDITYKIQEYHLPIYHMICIAIENEFFSE